MDIITPKHLVYMKHYMIWYLTEQSELVIRKKSISFIQQEISPDELLEAPVLSLDEAVGSLAFWSVCGGGGINTNEMFANPHYQIKSSERLDLQKGRTFLESFQKCWKISRIFFVETFRKFETVRNVPYIFHPLQPCECTENSYPWL